MTSIGRRAWHPSLNFQTMRLTHVQLAELEGTGIVTIRDDARPGDDATLTELGLLVALNRLRASAASHHPRRCGDCAEDLPDHHTHSGLCDECAARRHELTWK
jgi:hypothetical protein